jgi:homoserine O-acetyltransferase
MSCRRLVALLALLLRPSSGAAQAPPQPTIASLGSCELLSGVTIPNCRIAYRAYGRLNASRTNAVLVPTWLLGRSEQWIRMLGGGPDKMIDTTRFYVVLVDALADGRSSSPSNTASEGRAAFEQLTIADMVEAQHRFVVEHLQLPRLHAVVGISMGGMQAFEWAVRYPDFLDAAVPIVGSPRVAPVDDLLGSMDVSIEVNGRRWGGPDDALRGVVQRAIALFLRTPMAVDTEPRAALVNIIRDGVAFVHGWSVDDDMAQLGAALRHNVAAPYGDDMTRAAARVRARMLIIYSWADPMVPAGPAAAFARLVHADTLSLNGACGHESPACESALVNRTVRAFLAR